MTTYLGKSCSFGLPRVPFVNSGQFMYLVISLLVLRAGCGIWLYQFLIIAYLFTLLNKQSKTDAIFSYVYLSSKHCFPSRFWIPFLEEASLFIYPHHKDLKENRGAGWLSGRVSDSGARGRRFDTYRRRVVSLRKTHYSPKVLVNYPGSCCSVPTWLKNCWLGR